jgi:hypothetical protein
MKRNILVGSMLCAALTVGAAAQSPAPSGQTSDQKQPTPNQTMTITGCLQEAGSAVSATGTSGSATKSPSKADNFVLANATAAATGGTTTAGAVASPDSRPAANTGTSPSAGTAVGSSSASRADAAQYKLSGGDKDQLRRYVDSKVEITGKIEGPAAARTATTGASASADTTSTGTRTPETKTTGQTLHIDSVHQLAPSCGV